MVLSPLFHRLSNNGRKRTLCELFRHPPATGLVGPVFVGIWVGFMSSGLGTVDFGFVAGPPGGDYQIRFSRQELSALNVAGCTISIGSAGLPAIDSFALTYYMEVPCVSGCICMRSRGAAWI